jgi:hypothetical protein
MSAANRKFRDLLTAGAVTEDYRSIYTQICAEKGNLKSST